MKRIITTALATLVAICGYSQDGIHLPLTGGALSGNLIVSVPTGNPIIQLSNSVSGSFPVFQLIDSRSGGGSWNLEMGRTLGRLAIRDNHSGEVMSMSGSDATFNIPLTGTSATFNSLVSANSYTDGHIIWTSAQINRPSGFVELQYLGSAGVKMFGGTSTPIVFNPEGAVLANSFSDGHTTFISAQINRPSGFIELQYPGTAGIRMFGETATPIVFNPNGSASFTGNIGIGTTNPQGYKLAVAGNVIAEEVKVKLQGTWPDYVFNDDYKITPLSEIQAYIRKNKHLPQVPSAKEIEETGVNLGEMNILLLKKLEELTLHLIALKDSNDELKKEVAQLKSKIK